MPLNIDQLIKAHYFQFLDLAISPDDQQALAVFGNYDVPEEHYSMDIKNRSLWRIQLCNGEMTELAPRDEDAHSPCWSPDGNRIAYLSRRSGHTELWVMDTDGSSTCQATEFGILTYNPFGGGRVLWSPAERYIAYATVPNGNRRRLAARAHEARLQRIMVRSPKIDKQYESVARRPVGFESAIYVYDCQTSENKQFISCADNEIVLHCWSSNAKRLIVQLGSELKEFDISSGDMRMIYAGPSGLIRNKVDTIQLARVTEDCVEVGTIVDTIFTRTHSIKVEKQSLQLHAWSHDGTRLFGLTRDGVTTALAAIDLKTSRVENLTPSERVASTPRSLHESDGVVFPYQGPSDPPELWLQRSGGQLKKLSGFYNFLAGTPLPQCRVVHYPSGNWTIEAIVVYPLDYEPGKKSPTLVYLHGGPERCVQASFSELISARAESAAHYLATAGYAVLLPNFRGSTGYGREFEQELGDYQIVQNPFLDVMAGIDWIVAQGIADPNRLGIYGCSYGGWLAAWTVSQSKAFKGAVATLGRYDLLSRDRMARQPFYSLRPNRRGSAHPEVRWFQPNIYKKLSPVEHIERISTPMLLIETEPEHRAHDAVPLYNGLCATGNEVFYVRYPQAFHNGGWKDEYKRDYSNRLVAWFDHCLQAKPLPNWFEQDKISEL